MAEKETFNIDKHKDPSEWYNEILRRAELVDLRYNVKGFVVHRPWLMRMIKELYRIWEAQLEADGHEPALFPLVIPVENFEKEKEHVEGFNAEVFWVTEAGGKKLEEKLALRPTSETAFYQMYGIWIRSYADLPLKLYQSCAVYRHETKATRPLLRGREFLWIEAHDAFATAGEALQQVKSDMEMTERVVHEALGVPFIFFKRPAWDKFKGAEDTYAADALMPGGKALQLPSTHFLGQRFSKAFGVQFEDSDGKKKYVYQTCYGPPIWRAIAAAILTHGDSKGMVLPFSIAPLHAVIVPIIFEQSKEAVMKYARGIESALEKRGLRVRIDDSPKRPGEKYYFWEMKGVPFRIEVGPKEADSNAAVLVRRDTGAKMNVAAKDLADEIFKNADDMLQKLKACADQGLQRSLHRATTMKELKDALKQGGFIAVDFCSVEQDGEPCAKKLKEETVGAEVRGTWFGRDEKPKGKCIVCGKPAKHVVWVAKAY